MTGFGRAARETKTVAVQAEARSVNSRHLKVRCRLPADWARLEPRLESLVKSKLQRGAVELHVRIRLAATTPVPRIDEKALAVYRRALAKLGSIDGAALLRLPGVVTLGEKPLAEGAVERTAVTTATEALAALQRTRRAEGQRLALALRRELAELERHLKAVVRLAPAAVRRQHAALRRRLGALLDGHELPSDDPALQRELALLADRSDVTEEIDRLRSHVQAFRGALGSSGTVGRELEFLLQEMGREVNTIGSKSADVRLTERVVRLKSCLERLREQSANIE